MSQVENNKLIAEFMEFSPSKAVRNSETGKYYDYFADENFPVIKEQDIWVESELGNGLVEQDFLYVEDLKFHSSWDWLMPVVEKIESLSFSINISSSMVYINGDTGVIVKAINIGFNVNKIQAVYNAVVEFIKWYNTQTK